MKNELYSIRYGQTDICYALIRSRRKSLEIAVHPDKRVVVKSPVNVELDEIEQRIRKRARWIVRQIRYFEQFYPRRTTRRYVGGESHFYLGRQYRLKVSLSSEDSVVLKNGYFYIACSSKDSAIVESLLDKWYKHHAEIHLAKLFDMCWENFAQDGLSRPDLSIRRMKKRWGSLSVRGRLTLNLDLVQVAKESIEYVIIHELCHLRHHNHNAAFYQLLDSIMPDWAQRKHRLEMALA